MSGSVEQALDSRFLFSSLWSSHFGVKGTLFIGLDLLRGSAQWSSNWWSLWSSSFMTFSTTFISLFFFDWWIRWSQTTFMRSYWKFSLFYLKQVPISFPLLWFEPARLPPQTTSAQRKYYKDMLCNISYQLNKWNKVTKSMNCLRTYKAEITNFCFSG